MDKAKLQWHPAFSAALRITLQDEMKYLEMHEEYLLGKKPLQMDILLIKKIKNISIRKSIQKRLRSHLYAAIIPEKCSGILQIRGESL